MEKIKLGVIGLRMGYDWTRSASKNPDVDLKVVYDKRPDYCKQVAKEFSTRPAVSEKDFFNSGIDIAVVATPDHLHVPQSIEALSKGMHVICEKPLAPTVADCKKLIEAVKKYKRYFMVGQVGRYAPGFKMAKKLIDEGEIGQIAFIESEYAHDYTHSPGVDNWRKDPKIKREGFIGGGCHALDLIRWMVGDPYEVFCYTNRILLKDWPADDTGIAIYKFKNNIIGKVFVSIGIKREYTMRTAVYGTKGSIVCDNRSETIKLYKDKYLDITGTNKFWEIPVVEASHNVGAEIAEFISYVRKGKQSPTDVYEGTKTVAFGEAALKSAKTGKPVKIDYKF